MAELWLVCEGEPQSVDVAVLKPLFANVLTAEIVVESACGSSPNIVATFLENHREGGAAYLNDRDYQPRAKAEAAFTDGRPGFFCAGIPLKITCCHRSLWFGPLAAYASGLSNNAPANSRNGWRLCPFNRNRLPTFCGNVPVSGLRKKLVGWRRIRLWTALPSSVGQVHCRRPPTPSGDAASVSVWKEALCQEVERVKGSYPNS